MEKKEIDELRFEYCSRMNKAAQKDSKEHDQDKTTILTSLRCLKKIIFVKRNCLLQGVRAKLKIRE